jgi:hypothetical protein
MDDFLGSSFSNCNFKGQLIWLSQDTPMKQQTDVNDIDSLRRRQGRMGDGNVTPPLSVALEQMIIVWLTQAAVVAASHGSAMRFKSPETFARAWKIRPFGRQLSASRPSGRSDQLLVQARCEQCIGVPA